MGLYPSLEPITTASPLYESYGRPTSTSSIDSWGEFGRSQNSWFDPSRNDDAVPIPGSEMPHQMQKPDEEHFSSPSHELVRITKRHKNDELIKTIVNEV